MNSRMNYKNRTMLEVLGLPMYLAMVILIFISFECQSWAQLLTFWWLVSAGIGGAYAFLWNFEQLPNLLIHLPIQSLREETSNNIDKEICIVCKQLSCKRHRKLPKLEEYQPWMSIKIPSAVNVALLKFIEKVLESYVYAWYRKNWSEAYIDTLRLGIRYTAAKVFRKAQKVDIPKLVLSKLLKDIITHLHVYLSAREKLPERATIQDIETAVVQEYGCNLHKALRGKGTEQQYMQFLVESVIPHLIPADSVQSKLIKRLLQQLLTDGIFLQAMNYVTKPDFINRFVLLLLDRDSRMLKTVHPTPSIVLLHGLVRPNDTIPSKLRLSTVDILQRQDYLYVFMKFMKTIGAVNELQGYLTLGDMESKLSSVIDEPQSLKFMEEVIDFHQSYLLETTLNHVLVDDELIDMILDALHFTSPLQQVKALKQCEVLSRLKNVMYNLMNSVFCPLFHESKEFYTMLYGEKSPAASSFKQQSTQPQKEVRSSSRRKIHSRISKMYSLNDYPSMEQEIPTSTSPFEPIEISDTELSSPTGYIPQQVTVVDAQRTNIDGGIIPRSTLYIIESFCVKTEAESIEERTFVTGRRYKEFLVLDTKLKQFYNDVDVSVPPKKPFRNPDAHYLDQRRMELQQYLNDLLNFKRIQNSELFGAFLMGTSDSSLFSVDSVGNIAGKMIKKSFKTERGQNLEAFLQTLLDTSVSSMDLPSPKAEEEVIAIVDKHLSVVNEHQESVESNANMLHVLSDSAESPPAINGMFDIIMYLAQHVYKVSPVISCVLIGLKILGQHTIESFILNFLSSKVDLLMDERQVVMIIQLLHENLFYDGPQRTAENIHQRQEELMKNMLQYPPDLLIRVIGKDQFVARTALIHEGLQSHILNKQMVYTLLDTILIEAFPELQILST